MLAAFGQLVIRPGGVDESIGRLLRSLFERRNDADYGAATLADEDAVSAIEDATRVVDAVAGWLAHSPPAA